MKRSVSVLLFVLITSTSGSAFAIRRHHWVHGEPSVYLTPRIGIISLSDAASFEALTGFTEVSDGIIGIDIGFRVVDELGIAFEIADVPASRTEFGQKWGGDIVFLNFDMFYDIPTGSSVYPFVDLGVGRMEIDVPREPDFGYTTIMFGGGIKVRVHRNAGLSLSVRHVRPFLEADALANTQVTAGISFIF